MEPRQARLFGLEVEVGQIEVRLEVARVVPERAREAVEGPRGLARVELPDAEVTVGVGDLVPGADRLQVRLRRTAVAALVLLQRLLERAEPQRKLNQLSRGCGEEIELAAQLRVDLLQAKSLARSSRKRRNCASARRS